MNFIAILTVLGLEQWRAFHWRGVVEKTFLRSVRGIERRFNGGTREQGLLALLVALSPVVLVAAAVFWGASTLHPVLGFAWNVVVLYLLMGFRRFSHAYTEVTIALRAGDLHAARRALAAWRGVSAGTDLSSDGIARLTIERGLLDSYRQVFAMLFWFTLLPGPAGAVLYRAAALIADEWGADVRGSDTTPMVRALGVFGAPARRLLWLLDWIPVRLTALSFAIVGDFEDAASCWRTQAKAWSGQEGGEHAGVILAAGAGAIGVLLGGALPTIGGDPEYRPDLGTGEPADVDLLPSAVGLVWRALVLWLLLILLLTLAYWAP
jgi:adenosylcobinamide-phosphate synthase